MFVVMGMEWNVRESRTGFCVVRVLTAYLIGYGFRVFGGFCCSVYVVYVCVLTCSICGLLGVLGVFL